MDSDASGHCSVHVGQRLLGIRVHTLLRATLFWRLTCFGGGSKVNTVAGSDYSEFPFTKRHIGGFMLLRFPRTTLGGFTSRFTCTRGNMPRLKANEPDKGINTAVGRIYPLDVIPQLGTPASDRHVKLADRDSSSQTTRPLLKARNQPR